MANCDLLKMKGEAMATHKTPAEIISDLIQKAPNNNTSFLIFHSPIAKPNQTKPKKTQYNFCLTKKTPCGKA
jgi:hypothetical protein